MIGKEVRVLDKGFVMLTGLMPEDYTKADLTVVQAARTSYLGESKGEEKDRKLLKYLYRNGHHTPFEMVSFKFLIKAPLMVWWQWSRHRIASYNAQSGRYTPFKADDFYMPTEWRLQALDNKQGSGGRVGEYKNILWSRELKEHYRVSFELYENALELGIAKEQARLFLPAFGLYYTWVVKMNARSLMNFMKLRMHEHAQFEIREYANVLFKDFFQPIMPWTAEEFIR